MYSSEIWCATDRGMEKCHIEVGAPTEKIKRRDCHIGSVVYRRELQTFCAQ